MVAPKWGIHVHSISVSSLPLVVSCLALVVGFRSVSIFALFFRILVCWVLVFVSRLVRFFSFHSEVVIDVWTQHDSESSEAELYTQ
jgi:hypothetical protein